MPGVNNRPAGASKSGDKLFDVGQDRQPATGESRRFGVEKEILHVNHQQGGFLGIKFHPVGIERGDLIKPFGGLSLQVIGVSIRFQMRPIKSMR